MNNSDNVVHAQEFGLMNETLDYNIEKISNGLSIETSSSNDEDWFDYEAEDQTSISQSHISKNKTNSGGEEPSTTDEDWFDYETDQGINTSLAYTEELSVSGNEPETTDEDWFDYEAENNISTAHAEITISDSLAHENLDDNSNEIYEEEEYEDYDKLNDLSNSNSISDDQFDKIFQLAEEELKSEDTSQNTSEETTDDSMFAQDLKAIMDKDESLKDIMSPQKKSPTKKEENKEEEPNAFNQLEQLEKERNQAQSFQLGEIEMENMFEFLDNNIEKELQTSAAQSLVPEVEVEDIDLAEDMEFIQTHSTSIDSEKAQIIDGTVNQEETQILNEPTKNLSDHE